MNELRLTLKKMVFWERFFHVFWLIGPFILLIERTPADFWLSVIAIAFVCRSVIKRDVRWMKTGWVKFAFLFWAVCIVAALNSPLPAYSLEKPLLGFGFHCSRGHHILARRDRQFVYAMLVTTGVGMIIMCGISFAEMLLVGQKAEGCLGPMEI